MTNIFKWKLMADQRNHRGWTGVGAIALAMGLNATAAWGAGASPSSAPNSGVKSSSSLTSAPVSGGSGTIRVTGHVVNSSCAVSVDKNSDKFILSQSQVRNAAVGDVFVTFPFTFTLSQCANTPLVFLLRMPDDFSVKDYFFGSFKSILYHLFLPANSINRTQWQTLERAATKALEIDSNSNITLYNYNLKRSALLFTPSKEIEQFTINMEIAKSSVAYTPSAEAEEITATFTYEFVYY